MFKSFNNQNCTQERKKSFIEKLHEKIEIGETNLKECVPWGQAPQQFSKIVNPIFHSIIYSLKFPKKSSIPTLNLGKKKKIIDGRLTIQNNLHTQPIKTFQIAT